MHRTTTTVDLVNTGTGTVYLGSAGTVTTGNGFPLLTLTSRTQTLQDGDELWLIGPTGPNVVAVRVS
jgi:hypothetical protein